MQQELNSNKPARQRTGDFGDILASKLAPRTDECRQADDVVVAFPLLDTAPPASTTAIAFLVHFDPDGWHNLVAICPETRALSGRTFRPGSWDEMAEWIDARDGRLNLFFSINEPGPSAPNTKLGIDDIAALRSAWVDMDPQTPPEGLDPQQRQSFVDQERRSMRAQIDRALKGPVPPSFVVDSGSGFHLYWRLANKLLPAEWSEELIGQNRGLIDAFEGDRVVYDVPRILRLPGTVNIPDSGKIAKGRVSRRSQMIGGQGTVYTLDQLAAQYTPSGAVHSQADQSPDIAALMSTIDLSVVTQAAHFEDLPNDLRVSFEAAMEGDAKLRRLWENGDHESKDQSASTRRFLLAQHLVGHEGLSFTQDEFGALLWVWPLATKPGDEIHGWDDFHLRREISRIWVKCKARAKRPLPNPDEFFDVLPDEDRTETLADASKPKPRLDLVSFCDAAATALARSTKPLIKGLLDQGALSVLYGESNVGKTFVAMDIAFHIATGLDWGRCRTAHLGVVYVAAEGGQGASRRALAMQRRYGDVAGPANFHFRLAGVDLRRPDADLLPLIETVKACEGVGLVVIDTLSRALAGGDENASTDMGALVKNVDRLRQATRAHVMLVHHSGKERARGARGHSLLRAATDTEIEIADNEIIVTKQRDLGSGLIDQSQKITAAAIQIADMKVWAQRS